MIKSFEVPVSDDGTLKLPDEVKEALRIAETPKVTILLTPGVAHFLRGPLTLEEIRGSLPALDHDTDQIDDDVLLDATELVLADRRK
ncbi:MAG: hypothetical protein ACRDHN_00980 [Thermomicrobiales bacterium]